VLLLPAFHVAEKLSLFYTGSFLNLENSKNERNVIVSKTMISSLNLAFVVDF
jgi:hypothetical protein